MKLNGTVRLGSVALVACVACLVFCRCRLALAAEAPSLWDLAKLEQQTHRFSTLFTAQDVRDHLGSEAGCSRALDWCKQTGVTKVYIEVYRDNYRAERSTLENARQRFQAAGFDVSGCVTTTVVGKASTGWKPTISCYTDAATQARLQSIFEYAASLFDEIMIDDFWFTDCACPDCDAARRAKTVRIGEQTYPVGGDTWEDYRCELMCRLSTDRVLGPARRINPKARLIIKYPQWYDNFHERGYEVVRETADFDRIWVGTETRDYNDSRWGGTPQYEGYFIMRWLGGIGGAKCGGGWYDPLGTTERTYVEQARQTVLAGARESMLFAYGTLQHGSGPNDILALRQNVPELLEVAKEVSGRRIMGVAAYKPPNSHPGNEKRIFDFIGMIGLPLVPCYEFPTNAPAAFFSVHALKDPDFAAKLGAFVRAKKPVLLTDELRRSLPAVSNLDVPNVHVIAVKGDPKSLLELAQKELEELRAPVLRPLKVNFKAPNRVTLVLFKDQSWVIENFNDQPVQVVLNGQPMSLPARSWKYDWK
jgi:hypothetical protein